MYVWLHRTPAERVCAAPPKAAHTAYNDVTRAVFHASMFALNADANWNACEPNHTWSMPTKSARITGARTHLRGSERARVRRTRAGPSAHACAEHTHILVPTLANTHTYGTQMHLPTNTHTRAHINAQMCACVV